MSSSTYVQLVDLAKYFGKVKALDGLSLDIAQGELVALLGPSGCGKTTALRALAGLQELDRGQLMVDGKDVTFQSASKRGMGMVFQAYSLFPHMTARENVEYGLKLRTHKISSQKRKERSAELLELVAYPPTQITIRISSLVDSNSALRWPVPLQFHQRYYY